MGPLRWGIMSCGKISHDFVVASEALPPSEHQVVAVAARSLENAKTFATTHNISKAYGSYDELVKDTNIDVVYIGSINPQHLSMAKLALSNGKPVLLEKPLCMNVKEVRELVEFAKSKKIFLMEALWSRFFPVYKSVREEIDKGNLGQILQVFVSFGFAIEAVDRIAMKELGGGSVLDLGVYCVQLASFVFGGEKPVKIITGGHLNKGGVDESTSTTLIYSNGRTATLVTHCRVEMPNEAFIVGTKGSLKINKSFQCPTELTLTSGEIQTFPLPSGKETKYGNSMGLQYQCHEVHRCIRNGLLESPIVSHKESILIAEIMESMRKQVGVVYPQDA